jgi:glutamate-ammonia-ligase adenylyltransferase
MPVSRLLLAEGLSPEEVSSLLAPYGFADAKRADANIQQMAGEPRSRALLAGFLGDLLGMIVETAEPDQALTHWERYAEASGNRTPLFDYLRGSPRMLHLLCSIFGNSPYLAQTLIRDPLLVYWLAEEQVLRRRPSRPALAQTLHAMLGHVTATELKLDALRRFKRREMLRIGVRDLLRLSPVPETVGVLSDLATVLIQAALHVVEQDLRLRYGMPMHRDGRGKPAETGFVVMALGKLGGSELNYSSDVDLIYVYESEQGATNPKHGASITNEEYFEYLARALTRALTEPTQEGYVFRVDLRLRAEGSVGRLARSIDDYARYYGTRGEDWERLAMLKAWPVAGSRALGLRFLRMVQPFMYGTMTSEPEAARKSAHALRADRPDRARAIAIVRDVKRIKDLIDERMASRGQQRRNVKLGTGGIREIEFLIQAVQILCGGHLPGIRDRNTLGALARFSRYGLLSRRECAGLTEAYGFLRDVEHKLQMVHDLQTHALPESRDELAGCAVRLGYGGMDRREALGRFKRDYERHTTLVHRLFDGFFGTPERSRLLAAVMAEKRRDRKKVR